MHQGEGARRLDLVMWMCYPITDARFISTNHKALMAQEDMLRRGQRAYPLCLLRWSDHSVRRENSIAQYNVSLKSDGEN